MTQEKIDLNGYFGNWPYWRLRHGSEDEILRLMDKFGISRMVVTSLRAIFSDWAQGNEEVKRMVRSHPDRFLWSTSINPVLGENHIAKFEEYLNDATTGLYLYPLYHNYDLKGQGSILENILRRAEEVDLPVFIPIRLMMNWSMPVLPMTSVAELTRQFSNLTIILSGINYGELKQALPLLFHHPKVFIITSCLQLRGVIEQLVTLIGVERIFFGTGMPLQNPACEVAKIGNLELSNDQKNRIFYGNSAEFLKLSSRTFSD